MKLVNKKRHTLVAGSGRAGTSLLVKIFDKVGLSTSIDHPDEFFADMVRAGHELPWNSDNLPYIIKSPYSYEWLIKKSASELLASLDFAIIPVRRYAEAANSRLINEYISMYSGQFDDSHPSYGDWQESPPQSIGVSAGGYHFSLDPREQERFLASCTMSLLYLLATAGVRVIVIPFPEFGCNPKLACRLLRPFLRHHQIPESKFEKAISETYDPSIVHRHENDNELQELSALIQASSVLDQSVMSLNEASHRALFRLYLEAKRRAKATF